MTEDDSGLASFLGSFLAMRAEPAAPSEAPPGHPSRREDSGPTAGSLPDPRKRRRRPGLAELLIREHCAARGPGWDETNPKL